MNGCTISLSDIKDELGSHYPHLLTKTGQVTRSKDRQEELSLAIQRIVGYLTTNIIMVSNYLGSKTKHTFLCTKCNLRWKAHIATKISCPSCTTCRKLDTDIVRNRLKHTNIRLLTPITAAKDTGTFYCLSCNNVWETQVSSITNNSSGCPNCARASNYLYLWKSTCGVLKIGVSNGTNLLYRINSVANKHELIIDDIVHFYLPQGAISVETLGLHNLRKVYPPYSRSIQDGFTEMFEVGNHSLQYILDNKLKFH